LNDKINIIFDLDGTLADTAKLTAAAFKTTAPKLNIPEPPVETIRAAVGYSCPEFYFRIFPDLPHETVMRISDEIEREEDRLLPDFTEDLLFPGVRGLLEELKIKNIPMYIASTGSENHVFSVLKKTGVTDYFKKILCGKPEKAGMIAEIIGAGDKNLFLMVGDMKKDVDGARLNGIAVIGACYGYCKRGTGFDAYVGAPGELPGFLEKYFFEKNLM